jgi:hypothetical protein
MVEQNGKVLIIGCTICPRHISQYINDDLQTESHQYESALLGAVVRRPRIPSWFLSSGFAFKPPEGQCLLSFFPNIRQVTNTTLKPLSATPKAYCL